MANVKQLTDKKTRLTEQLATLSADTEAKIVKVEESHVAKVAELTKTFDANIVKLTEAKDLKVSATRVGITARKEKLEADIIEVDEALQNEVATLQAQLDAIRGVADSIPEAPVQEEIKDSEDLV